MGTTAPTQANRVLSFTKRFLNWCVSRDYLDFSPANEIAKFKSVVSRVRVLSDEKMVSVYDATWSLDYPFGHLFRILILRGNALMMILGFDGRKSILQKNGGSSQVIVQKINRALSCTSVLQSLLSCVSVGNFCNMI